MSIASRPGPDAGTDRAGVSSVKIAGSREDAPYTAAVDRTIRWRRLSDRWQAASNCMVPRTFISLAMLRAADEAGVAEADACTTVSTPAASMTLATNGFRMSTRAKS